MVATQVLTSRAEYEARTAAGERLEFDDGNIIEMPNNDSIHDGIKETLVCEFLRQLPRPVVAANEQAFEVAPDKIRHPDVALNLQRRPRLSGKKFQGSPDLAIEIVSPSESANDLHAKVRLYLENGATAVWVIWPEGQEVEIHQLNQPTRLIGSNGVIENEEPVPSFRLPVAALFS